MKYSFLFILLALALFACKQDELPDPLDTQLNSLLDRRSPDGDGSFFLLPESSDLKSVPQGIGNPLTPEKVELGKMLFFETGLGQDAVREDGKETFSCASCHIPSSGFMPGRVQGIADGGLGFGYKGEARYVDTDYREEELDVQGARPLSLLNVAYVTNSTWSGKFGAHGVNKGTEFAWDNEEATKINYMGLDGLESQNIEGLALHRMVVNEEVLRKYGYLPMFDEAFPDMPEDQRYSPIAASFAISAYLRTLLPNEAPFQRWLKGEEEALTDQEKLGAILFFGKAGCYRCHKEPGLNSMEFHAVGVRDLYEAGGLATGINDNRNLGRGGFTGRAEDMYKFKVPQLYNMGDSPFYFHGSSKRSLEDVVRYFNDAIPENERVPDEQISPFFTPLNLTDQEIDNITAFLENGLRDPNLERYQPDFVLSGNCFPNNDPVSRSHLGCY